MRDGRGCGVGRTERFVDDADGAKRVRCASE